MYSKSMRRIVIGSQAPYARAIGTPVIPSMRHGHGPLLRSLSTAIPMVAPRTPRARATITRNNSSLLTATHHYRGYDYSHIGVRASYRLMSSSSAPVPPPSSPTPPLTGNQQQHDASSSPSSSSSSSSSLPSAANDEHMSNTNDTSSQTPIPPVMRMEDFQLPWWQRISLALASSPRLTVSRPARPGLFSPERMRVDAKNSDARGVMWPFLVLLSMIIPLFAMWRFRRSDPDGFERQRVKIIAFFRHLHYKVAPGRYFTEEDLMRMMADFDMNGDGYMEPLEFQAVFSVALHYPISYSEVQHIMSYAPWTGKERVKFREFYHLLLTLKRAEQIFSDYDVDLEGFVTSKEIREVFKQTGNPLGDEEFKDMIAMADYNNDGKIEWKEFVWVLMTKRGTVKSRRALMRERQQRIQAAQAAAPTSSTNNGTAAPVVDDTADIRASIAASSRMAA